MRSPILIASSMSCVTKTTVFRTSLVQAQELVLEPVASDRVDRAERLVHQHQRRVGGQRAGEADALALAAARAAPGSASAYVGSSPTSSSSSAARSSIRAFGQPSSRGTVAMFSATVMCGKRPTCWMT